MIPTVKLGEKHVNSTKLPNETSHYKLGVFFDNPANSNVAPDGYMTVEEFRNESKKSLTKLLNEHGIY